LILLVKLGLFVIDAAYEFVLTSVASH